MDVHHPLLEFGRLNTMDEAKLLHATVLEIGCVQDTQSALQTVLRRICESMGWVLGQAWLSNQDGTALELNAVCVNDDSGNNTAAFVSQSRSMTFAIGQDSIGKVWASQLPVWISDVTLQEDFRRGIEANTAGIRTALAVPVLGEGEIVAVLEFFRHDRLEEDEALEILAATLAAQLGWTIRHKLALDAIRVSADLLKCQNRVLELAAQGAPLHKMLDILLREIEEKCAGMLCSILLLDADGVHVRHGAAPSLPESYIREIDGRPIGPRAGSCGTAAFRREPVIVGDIATDPLWDDYREFALQHNLRACWSTPIFDGQRNVLGTFALYFRTACLPAQRHQELIEMATHTAAIAIVKCRETEALRVSEERLRLAVNGGKLGIWEWDTSTNRLIWNDELKAAFGWARDEELTLPMFMEAIHHEDRSRLEPALARCLADHADCNIEYRVRLPNGSLHWIEAKGSCVCDLDGRLERMVGVAIDITERKQAEEQIRKSRMELQGILDNSPALIYMKDPAGRYVFVNRSWAEVFHIDDKVHGKTDFDLFPEEAARQFVVNDKKVLASPQALEFEEEATLADGVHYYRSIKVALRDRNQGSYALCGISTDISERKRADEALRQTNRALRVLSHCNSAVVHATDEQALLDEVCRIAVGQAGYKMAWVGYAEQDEACTVRPVASAGPIEGFLDHAHVSWADNQYGRGAVGPAIREKKPEVRRHLLTHPAFSIWHELFELRNFQSILALPLRNGDSVLGVLAIYAEEAEAFDSAEVEFLAELSDNLAHGIISLRALSERAATLVALEQAQLELEQRVVVRTAELQGKNQELEQEVKERESVEELLRSKNEELKAFAYTVSHDLKAPLRGIAGYSQELVRRHGQGLGERGNFCLKQILAATHNLDTLIEDLLRYSRLDAETPTPIEVNLASLIDGILKSRKQTILDLGSEISLSLSVASVTTWERGLLQVLANLIDNALKYSRDARPPHIHISSEKSSDSVLIAVSDNGIGFDMKYHDRIFGLFNRLVRQEDFEGTGAGLAIVKKVVEKLGGRIRAESTLGSGAKFILELPAERTDVREAMK